MRRLRVKSGPLPDPKEIADHLRSLGCTEKQISRHLKSLPVFLSRKTRSAVTQPVTAPEEDEGAFLDDFDVGSTQTRDKW